MVYRYWSLVLVCKHASWSQNTLYHLLSLCLSLNKQSKRGLFTSHRRQRKRMRYCAFTPLPLQCIRTMKVEAFRVSLASKKCQSLRMHVLHSTHELVSLMLLSSCKFGTKNKRSQYMRYWYTYRKCDQLRLRRAFVNGQTLLSLRRSYVHRVWKMIKHQSKK